MFLARHGPDARQRVHRGVVLHAAEGQGSQLTVYLLTCSKYGNPVMIPGPQEDQRQPLRRAGRRHRVHERPQAIPLAAPLGGRENTVSLKLIFDLYFLSLGTNSCTKFMYEFVVLR